MLETSYKKGVSIGKKVFQSIADRITRHLLLPKYYVTIQPQKGWQARVVYFLRVTLIDSSAMQAQSNLHSHRF